MNGGRTEGAANGAGTGSFSFSKKVAVRYLWSKRSEAFITIISVISVLGVAIGVCVLDIVMAVMTGFETELRDKIVGANSHVVVRKLGAGIDEWRDAQRRIGAVSGVLSVSPFSYNQALIRTDNQSTGLLIRGIERGSAGAEQLAGYLGKADEIGELFDPTPVMMDRPEGGEDAVTLPGLVVGRELAHSLGLSVGSTVSLLAPQLQSTPFGLIPKFRRFLVVGVYASGLIEYESGLGYVSLPEAQRFFQTGDKISGFEVRVDDLDRAPAIATAIAETLGAPGSGFYAQPWTETNKPLWDAIRLEKRVYFIVLLLIVVMASFSIVTTLIMIVLEKRRDIAVLKTIGASTRAIADIFRIQGAVIGLVGTVLGTALGVAGCVGLQWFGFPLDQRIFQMSSLPIRMEPLNFFGVAISAFIICCVAGVYPARRASMLEPSEVLRFE